MKTRAEPRAPVEIGNASAVLCHAANALIRLFPRTGPGLVVEWDPAREAFVGNDDANSMLVPEQRDPWA